MSEENVELAYRVHEALKRRDLDALLALADPDIEYFPCIRQLEGGGPTAACRNPKLVGEHARHRPDFSTEVEDVRDLGDITVARAHIRGHGIASGASMEQTLSQVAEWRQKKCARRRTFASEAEALEAAGLRE